MITLKINNRTRKIKDGRVFPALQARGLQGPCPAPGLSGPLRRFASQKTSPVFLPLNGELRHHSEEEEKMPPYKNPASGKVFPTGGRY
ncbi:hypothetical protein HMPREF3038_00379 [Akkermansia sp. KLE1797]|nr:hypothetical protein HMPREF3038_00379 [Akkermansia sp. KLE1797]KXU55027.1 hypothetical protein HMPREF3039_00752 [Akkermansia sp. KLE1798]KZA04341.1 hypothetical protein HMPREF1326_02009 [Akkermansia sp. KLE1605]